ncbi:MAG: hypothetical protein AAF690_00640 [Acidobacteriota bacterium]
MKGVPDREDLVGLVRAEEVVRVIDVVDEEDAVFTERQMDACIQSDAALPSEGTGPIEKIRNDVLELLCRSSSRHQYCYESKENPTAKPIHEGPLPFETGSAGRAESCLA